MSDLFYVGETLPCKVMSIKTVKKKLEYQLSIKPRDVNAGVQHSSLTNGMVSSSNKFDLIGFYYPNCYHACN